jgi:diketogulonate reductase-like aldo/keto reductase
VAPGGGLTEEVDITTLDALSPETLATEAASAGLRHIDTREIPTSERYIGSAVCILERP